MLFYRIESNRILKNFLLCACVSLQQDFVKSTDELLALFSHEHPILSLFANFVLWIFPRMTFNIWLPAKFWVSAIKCWSQRKDAAVANLRVPSPLGKSRKMFFSLKWSLSATREHVFLSNGRVLWGEQAPGFRRASRGAVTVREPLCWGRTVSQIVLPRSAELSSQSEVTVPTTRAGFLQVLCNPLSLPLPTPHFHGNCDLLPAHWPDSLLNIIYDEICPCQVQLSSFPFLVFCGIGLRPFYLSVSGHWGFSRFSCLSIWASPL